MAGYEPQDFNFAFSSEQVQDQARRRGGIKRRRKESRVDYDRRASANADLQQAFTDKFNQISNAFPPSVDLPMPKGKITRAFAQSFVYGKKSDEIDEIVYMFTDDKPINKKQKQVRIHQSDLLTFFLSESTSLINFINNGEKMINLLSTTLGYNVRSASNINYNYVYYLLQEKGLI